MPPQVKSLNYLNSILGKIEAIEAGVGEALMINNNGYVTECTTENIFIVKNGLLITPPLYVGILEGITRDTVMNLAKEDGITVREEPYTVHDIYISDECFVTGTGAEIIPVINIDGRLVGDGKPGPVTKKAS